MRARTKIALGTLALVLVAATAAWSFRGEIAVALVKRTVEQALTGDPLAALPDGLHLGLCGAGSPFADARRAGPCVAVIAGRRLFVVDAGDGAARNLQLMNLPPGQIEAVLLTHFHSDHIDGLGGVMVQRWVGGGHERPVPVHGPTGVEAIVAGFNQAYAADRGYRVAHHGSATVRPAGAGGEARPFQLGAPRAIVARAEFREVTVLESEGLKITAFEVSHAPIEPAVGYAFTYKGRRLVISGDTTADARVETAAKGADLLVHEALSPRLVGIIGAAAKTAGRENIAKIMADIVDYHATPEQAAALAQRAGARHLLLHHIVPALPSGLLEGPFLGKARTLFSGTVQVGRDGDFISLPAGSDAILVSNRLRQ
ncbi:MAG TPA: MBL fold metallo-hydrolase [Beijerinckiaceae bacterium]|nr:MBL fold metallo-hydrolase [Beijerinckiaceae bacterium]